MQQISVFDMMKIGVGPSSSHTMGPWRAAQRFLEERRMDGTFSEIRRIRVELFGSLAKTGLGHGTDIAIVMGLCGEDPATCDISLIDVQVGRIRDERAIWLLQEKLIDFDPIADLVFHFDQALPYHPNGMRFTAVCVGDIYEATYYSIGGGFVVEEGEAPEQALSNPPFPTECGNDILGHCLEEGFPISQMVLENEKHWRSEAEVRSKLLGLWDTMTESMYRGCHTEGVLPGGLNVQRRAPKMHATLIRDDEHYQNHREWVRCIQRYRYSFQRIVRWVSCFALAVNEENASFGRVVTAPTNGAAGVIPAVLMYYVCFYEASDEDIIRFLLVAGEIGSLFKKGATISAALGGCQAEIGVSSAMAAAALCERSGGTVAQSLMAAEIAMEHHLGLTCDPVGGLVQVPCIERNAMGAMKAITAVSLALQSSPEYAKVSLDTVIRTMWQTAKDMNDNYKETSEGGLAVLIPVNVSEC
ncbi:MAG: L-serine ammonia-lyase [Candidatus Promineifilaceae bacterium]|jgi:L-serine dehydratase